MTTPSPNEIAIVLKHLPPHSKSVFIAEKAKDQNMAWLRGMAEQGAFLVPLEQFREEPSASNARFVGANDFGFSNVIALAGVIDGADFDALGQIKALTRFKPVTLQVSDDFKSFLYETVLALMHSANEFRDNEKPPAHSKDRDAFDGSRFAEDMQIHTQRLQRFGFALDETFLALLQTACACDDGKTANLLLQGTNRLGTMHSPSRILGTVAAVLQGDEKHRSEARVNAMYTAMLFSAHSALDALEQHGFPLQGVIALYPRAAGQTKSTDPLKVHYPDPYSARMPVDFIGNNALPCTGRMLERVLRGQHERGFREVDQKPLLATAHHFLTKDRTPYEDELKHAFVHAGVFEIEGKTSVKLAIRHFDFELVDCLSQYINWLEEVPFGGTQFHWEVQSIFSNPIVANRPKDPEAEGPSGSEDLVLKLMELGDAAGHGFRFYGQQSPHQAALVNWAIEKRHPKVLVKMMENGLDPQGYLLLNDTAYGLADKAGNKDAEHAMRTFVAAHRARTLLDEMDEPARPAPSFLCR